MEARTSSKRPRGLGGPGSGLGQIVPSAFSGRLIRLRRHRQRPTLESAPHPIVAASALRLVRLAMTFGLKRRPSTIQEPPIA